MKKWSIYLLVALLSLTLVGGAAAVYAQQRGTPPQPMEAADEPAAAPPAQEEPFAPQEELDAHPRPLRGLQRLRGEVTAVHEGRLSVLTRNGQAVEVNVHSGTRIWLVEAQRLGSLEEIQAGDEVLVEGCRCGESSLGATRIAVGPEGDEVHGRVTAVEGSTIQLENQEGRATVLTSAETEFRLGREAAGLEEVSEGLFLAAFGELQSDGSLSAELVILRPPPTPPARNVRGEVTAVSATGLTMSVQPPRETDAAPMSVQVNVTDETQIWLVESERQGSLNDVQIGDRVLVRGRRAEESTQDAPTVDARHIAVGPDGDEVHGRVSAIDGSTLTLRHPEGEVTVHTGADTAFRRGREAAALEDVREGVFIVAFGELQADGSLDADQIILQRAPPPGPERGPEGSRGDPPLAGAAADPVPEARHSSQTS
jgi:hypothetical protein